MLGSFDFILPTKIRYGVGMIRVLGQELKNINAKNVMIITDQGLSKTDMLHKLTGLIQKEGIRFSVYDAIEANPKDYNVQCNPAPLCHGIQSAGSTG